MGRPVAEYPWYDMVQGEDLEQGDLFEACPIFSPPEDLAAGRLETATFRWEERDLIVLSQSCDMAPGREKLSDVLLCAVWNRSELTEGHLATNKGMEDARRGNLPAFHVLAACALPDMSREIRVVDFRRVYSFGISPQESRGRRKVAPPSSPLSRTSVASVRSVLHACRFAGRCASVPLARIIHQPLGDSPRFLREPDASACRLIAR